jgi:glycosyl hydrolase family 2
LFRHWNWQCKEGQEIEVWAYRDGQDACAVRVSIRDAEGRVVPFADNLVRFPVSGGGGRIIGVGNGDPIIRRRTSRIRRRSAARSTGIARLSFKRETNLGN